MNLIECFKAIEGDYEGVIGRLMTEERVKKFLLMFLKDTSFNTLCTAMDCADYETAFRAAHTLKGTCANLGIAKLQSSASELTEALRGGVKDSAASLFKQVKNDYEQTINAIKELN